MPLNVFVFIVIVVVLIGLLILAKKKKWIGPAGGIFTSQVMMHDLVNKDKQRAMEYIMEEQERTIKEEDETGEDFEGGKKNE